MQCVGAHGHIPQQQLRADVYAALRPVAVAALQVGNGRVEVAEGGVVVVLQGLGGPQATVQQPTRACRP